LEQHFISPKEKIEMEDQSKIWHFENFNILKALSDNEKQAFHSSSTIKHYHKKQIIYLPEDTSDHILFLEKGKIKISRYSEDGKEMILSILGPGQIFGELSLITHDKREEIAEAIDDSLICIIKADDLNKIIEGNPNFPLQVVKLISERIKRIEKRLELLYFKTVSERINEFILQLAIENGKEDHYYSKQIKVDLFLTHDEIAKLTATNRQTVTSVLNKLENQNVISYSRKAIIIKNIDALK
jgi:CRP-like cAMP-binding protein